MEEGEREESSGNIFGYWWREERIAAVSLERYGQLDKEATQSLRRRWAKARSVRQDTGGLASYSRTMHKAEKNLDSAFVKFAS